jgi:hypothetical protein
VLRLLQCVSPVVALSGHANGGEQYLLSGANRKTFGPSEPYRF